MGEGTAAGSDPTYQQAAPHIFAEANFIGGGSAEDRGGTESAMGQSQGTTSEGARKRKISNKAQVLSDCGLCCEKANTPPDDFQPYEEWTACRNPANLAVALYCGIGSSSLNALVNAFERLHMVRGWNSS